jgi:hypothetical protein
MFRRNFHDWRAYERVMGGDVSAIDAYELALEEAFMEGRACDVVPPPITQPDTVWHERLVEAWPEIRELAQKMLGGTDDVIELSNGQQLVRDRPNRWRNPDAPNEVDYNKSPG